MSKPMQLNPDASGFGCVGFFVGTFPCGRCAMLMSVIRWTVLGLVCWSVVSAIVGIGVGSFLCSFGGDDELTHDQDQTMAMDNKLIEPGR
jgi:hypothetical protein